MKGGEYFMTVQKAIKNALVAGALFALTAAPVLAATIANTTTSLTITAGALSITADLSAAFLGVSVSSSAQTTYTGSAQGNDSSDIAITAEDLRGESSPTGWDVVATVDELVSGSDTIAVTNFTTNFSSVTTNSGSSTGVSAGTGGTLTGSGTSDEFTVITATTGNGQGNYSIDMGFSLNIPAYQPAGSYAGDVDMSIS